ncbi:MAG: RHS repeat-associated core domain-containing protein, partial [Bacteroidota bacterium]
TKLKPNAIDPTNYTNSDQYQFYQNANLDMATDTRPFAERVYEPSPRARVLRYYGVGQNWTPGNNTINNADIYNDPSNGANHFTESNYEIYDASVHVPVLIWTFDFDAGGLNLTYQAPGNYNSGELIISEIIDEEGGKVRQFTDKLGQTILKQAFNEYDENQNGTIETTEKEVLETYYIYDDFGNLRLVIPPMGVQALKNSDGTYKNWSLGLSATIIDTWCFRYEYDQRQRMIEKESPQTDPSFVVYDALDRVVAVQDGEQNNRNEWSFTKYDDLNRPVMTGLLHTTDDRASLQSQADAAGINYQTQTPNFGPETIPDDRVLPDGYGYLQQGNVRAYLANNSLTLKTGLTFSVHEGHEYLFDLGNPAGSSGNPNPCTVTGSTFPVLDLDGQGAVDDEILTLSFYDDYDYNNDGTVDGTDITQSPTNYFDRTAGAITGTKIRVLDDQNPRWLLTTPYYDDRSRVIQVNADNHLGGEDILTANYDFVGRLLNDHLIHDNAISSTEIRQRYVYDFIGRPLEVYHQIDTQSEEKLCSYRYNEIGQVIEKIVGTNQIQNIDYSYNIRGWLRGINDSQLAEANEDDLFGMEIIYEGQNLILDAGNSSSAGTRQYNGNIAAIQWQSALDNTERAYAYEYDQLNRLKKADYAARNASTGNWTEEQGRFSVFNIQYDLNGNIQELDRNGLVSIQTPTTANLTGMSFGLMDDMSYQYQGNQLIAVNDASPNQTGVGGDFVDRASPSGDEYQYDSNGNLTSDYNKHITSITYNHLNLPVTILYENGNSIRYVYDAVGIKIQKIATEGDDELVSDYVGGFVYQNFQMEFIHTPEGRALAPGSLPEGNSTFVYEYQYVDHLGNLRLSFREGTTSLPLTATMESQNAPVEEREFANIQETRDGAHARQGSFSAKLDESQPMGPWKSISVQEGDILNVKAFAFYEDKSSNQNNRVNIQTFITATNPGYGSQNNNGETTLPPFSLSDLNLALGVAATPSPVDNATPNAYLAIILYAEDGTVQQDYVQLNAAAPAQTWTNKLEITNFVANKKGRVEIFLANESSTTVWFDDFEIKHQGGIIAEDKHYYPFGLELAGIGKWGIPENRYTFNGQSEKQKELNGGKGYFYETDWRNLDPQLGRFHASDPLADYAPDWTPYRFGFNNPVSWNDPTGLLDWYVNANNDVVYDENVKSQADLGEDETYLGEEGVIVDANTG